METHISHLLLELKHGLEKSLGSSDLKDESELVMDKLIAIEKTPMTSELITKSGLGNTIASIKEKFSDQSPLVSEKAKNILVLWKTIVKAQKNKPSTKTTTHRTTPSDGTASIEDPTLNFKNEERLSLLNQPRMAVVNIFRNQFKEILPPKAEKIALDIEEELNKKFPYDSVPKIYSSKAKSLSFNLAKNEVVPLIFSTVKGFCNSYFRFFAIIYKTIKFLRIDSHR